MMLKRRKVGHEMNVSTNRRQFLGRLAMGLPIGIAAAKGIRADDALPENVIELVEGNLKAVIRDNSESPRVLSGLDSLVHLTDAPDFDAFDPDSGGASAGLNFEHIISGHENSNNAFTPRKGAFSFGKRTDSKSLTLIRRREDDPWSMSSMLTYTLKAPHYVDMEFRCVPHDAKLFGKRGYAILFFANYMNDVENVALNFRGIEGAGQAETWISADAPPGPPDWNQGGTYRSSEAKNLEYDDDVKFRLNTWSYDYPRFTKPFYFGRAARGMSLTMMFDRMLSDRDEIRFSLFKFKLKRFPRPAWDFQYVIRNIQADTEYGFRARLVWKKFVSPEDCLQEYDNWASSLNKA